MFSVTYSTLLAVCANVSLAPQLKLLANWGKLNFYSISLPVTHMMRRLVTKRHAVRSTASSEGRALPSARVTFHLKHKATSVALAVSCSGC